MRGSFEIPYAQVAQWCEKYPDRFSGLAGVDPFRGVEGLRDLDRAVQDYGFVGAHLYPHWFKLAPDAALYYPYFARCCELDIPIMMQVGQNLIYQKDLRLPSVARPILLDQVAIDFPDLKLLGIHIGVPWTEEMIAMAWKHANVFIGIDAYAPKYIPASLLHYMNSYGADKVLFGTDWPVVDPERAVKEMADHNLKPAAFEKIMRTNALKVFRPVNWAPPPDSFRSLTVSSGLRAAALRDPGKTALIMGKEARTYASVVQNVNRIANLALHHLGLGPGRNAAIIAPNCMEYLEIVAGVFGRGRGPWRHQTQGLPLPSWPTSATTLRRRSSLSIPIAPKASILRAWPPCGASSSSAQTMRD